MEDADEIVGCNPKFGAVEGNDVVVVGSSFGCGTVGSVLITDKLTGM